MIRIVTTPRTALLIILSITMELGNAQTSQKLYDRAKIFQGSDHQSVGSEISVNFDRALNHLLNYTDFQPLVISVGYFVHSSNIHDLITKYFQKHPMNSYQYDLTDFGNNWLHLSTGLTWIIFIDDLETLKTKILENPDLWNLGNNFIIFSIDERVNKTEDRYLIDIFRTLWNRHRVFRVVITSMKENVRYTYRYSPFEKIYEEYGIVKVIDMEMENCDGEGAKLNVTSLIRKNEKYFCRKSTEWKLFEDFRNVNGHPIHVTVFESLMMMITMNDENETIYQLLDANVMNLVEKSLNTKFIINVMDTNNELDPFVEALKTIENDGISDFVFTGYFMKRYKKNFQFTSSISDDKLCLIAPSSKPVPKFFMPLLPFSNQLWLLLIIYNFTIALLWLFVRRIDSTFDGDRSPVNDSTKILIELSSNSRSKPTNDRLLDFNEDFPHSLRYRNLTNNNLARSSIESMKIWNEPPEINRWFVRCFDLSLLACSPLQGGKTCVERAFLFGTLFFGLIVIGLYQSYLVSSLSKPIFYPELNTLQDVAESNRTIITKYQNLMHDFFSDGSPELERLRDKVEVSASEEKTYDMVAYRGMIALGRFSSFKLENLTEYHDSMHNRMLLHIVEECPATYSLAYAARSNSPYFERVNRLLLIMQQAGLLDVWYDRMVRAVEIAATQTTSKRRDTRVKLTLQHLSLTFLGLGIGLFCCTILFIGELHFAKKFRPSTVLSVVRRPLT